MFPRFAQERISFPRAMSSVGAVKADIGLIFGILACCGPRQAFPVNVKIVLWESSIMLLFFILCSICIIVQQASESSYNGYSGNAGARKRIKDNHREEFFAEQGKIRIAFKRKSIYN